MAALAASGVVAVSCRLRPSTGRGAMPARKLISADAGRRVDRFQSGHRADVPSAARNDAGLCAQGMTPPKR
jgi:hypothetical protein